VLVHKLLIVVLRGKCNTRFKSSRRKGGYNRKDIIRDIKESVSVCGVEYENGKALKIFNISESKNNVNANQNGAKIEFDALRVIPTLNKNKPVNCTVNYCIKY
jgi:hypothetical protein